MALTVQFLESKGFKVTSTKFINAEWLDAINDNNLKLLKRPNEDWTIAISIDHGDQSEFLLTDEQQIVDLLNALNKPK